MYEIFLRHRPGDFIANFELISQIFLAVTFLILILSKCWLELGQLAYK